MRTMCSGKIVDRKSTEEQMDMLGSKETASGLVTAIGA